MRVGKKSEESYEFCLGWGWGYRVEKSRKSKVKSPKSKIENELHVMSMVREDSGSLDCPDPTEIAVHCIGQANRAMTALTDSRYTVGGERYT